MALLCEALNRTHFFWMYVRKTRDRHVISLFLYHPSKQKDQKYKEVSQSSSALNPGLLSTRAQWSPSRWVWWQLPKPSVGRRTQRRGARTPPTPPPPPPLLSKTPRADTEWDPRSWLRERRKQQCWAVLLCSSGAGAEWSYCGESFTLWAFNHPCEHIAALTCPRRPFPTPLRPGPWEWRARRRVGERRSGGGTRRSKQERNDAEPSARNRPFSVLPKARKCKGMCSIFIVKLRQILHLSFSLHETSVRSELRKINDVKIIEKKLLTFT